MPNDVYVLLAIFELLGDSMDQNLELHELCVCACVDMLCRYITDSEAEGKKTQESITQARSVLMLFDCQFMKPRSHELT